MKLHKYSILCTLMCIFVVTKGITQSTFQCKCSSTDVELCLKSGDNEPATKKAKEIYKVFKTGLQPGFDALKTCNKVSSFVAYYDNINDYRYVFYPEDKSLVNLDNPDWQTKGALLHAIVHLQRKHNGKANAYRQELEADSITITLLRKWGATYEESIQYLKITDSPKMPDYQSRVKSAYQTPPPSANFTVNCSNGCVEPCRVNFSSTSTNVHPNAEYFWNGEKLNQNIEWVNEMRAGEYVMKLKVINPDGQKSEFKKTVVVRKKAEDQPPPIASFTINCSNGCVEPCKVNFSSTSTNVHPNTKYLWNGQELGQNIKWLDEKWTGEYRMKLTVINPDGQKSECLKTVIVRKKPLSPLNPFRFGIQAGINYSPEYEFFSPRIGMTLSYHPDFWGFQAELNYVKRVSETYSFFSEYNPFWDDYDYYSSFSNYKIHNLELPLMLIIGRNREPKIGINALVGASINYGLSGNVRYQEYTSLANGFTDYYSENYPIEFKYDDYQRTQIRGILGFTVGFRIGNEYLYWGARVDAGMPNSQYFSPEISSYLMFKF